MAYVDINSGRLRDQIFFDLIKSNNEQERRIHDLESSKPSTAQEMTDRVRDIREIATRTSITALPGQCYVPPVPQRSDVEAILKMSKFIRRLLDPEDLGYTVDAEIRDGAREALGMQKSGK